MEDQTPTSEEQLASVVAAHNALVRKNRILTEKLSAVESASVDLQARAEEAIETLQRRIEELQAQLSEAAAETMKVAPDEGTEG